MEPSPRIRWQLYQGRAILLVDYTDLAGTPALIELLDEQVRLEQACTQSCLVCADFRDVRLSPNFLARAKNVGLRRQSTGARTALICLNALHHILLEEYIFPIVDAAVRSFNDKHSAFNWLVAEGMS